MRTLRILIGGVGLAAMLGGVASAAPAMHFEYLEDYDGTRSFLAGEGPCVPYAGTVHEVRHGGYELLVNGSGPHAGELKVTGTVRGYYEITPDDPGDGPSYAGEYREQSTGWLADPDDDLWRVGHFQLIGRLTGSDGGTLRLVNREKVTIRPDGTNVVDRDTSTCQ